MPRGKRRTMDLPLAGEDEHPASKRQRSNTSR